jgi:hypothetical protein
MFSSIRRELPARNETKLVFCVRQSKQTMRKHRMKHCSVLAGSSKRSVGKGQVNRQKYWTTKTYLIGNAFISYNIISLSVKL